ncbi:NAD(P)-binding protein [Stipitochalara longipes BDJ]|nr:NAD(P)-binding protein [Stipitochalara longipes BDJ]
MLLLQLHTYIYDKLLIRNALLQNQPFQDALSNIPHSSLRQAREIMDIEVGANIPEIKIYQDKFAGHVVVVTGAGQGIGEVTARLFASQGAQVVMLDIQEQKLKNVQSSIEQGGGKAAYQLCDVSDEKSVSEAIEWIVATYKKIDVLGHLAGIYPFSPLVNYPTEMYRRVISINVDASFWLTRAVLPHMQKAGYGRIILTSSSAFQEPEAGMSAYVASKGAVVGLMRATAVEAGPGVTANVIMPGLIKTDTVWNAAVRPDGSHPVFEMVVPKQLIKRMGRPEDIAHAICFIASPEAHFFTGQIFDCSGGETFH